MAPELLLEIAMALWTLAATGGLLAPVRPWAYATVARGRSGGAAATAADHEELISTLARQRLAVEQTIVKLAELEEELSPAREFCDVYEVMAPRGYLSKTAGCYLTAQAAGGSTGPPPSAMTLALSNFGRELKELTAMLVPYKTKVSLAESTVYAAQLGNLRLDNDKVWAREEALTESECQRHCSSSCLTSRRATYSTSSMTATMGNGYWRSSGSSRR